MLRDRIEQEKGEHFSSLKSAIEPSTLSFKVSRRQLLAFNATNNRESRISPRYIRLDKPKFTYTLVFMLSSIEL